MTLYVDTSALLKRFLDEPESEVAERLLLSDPELATARHTVVEVRRALTRLLDGESLTITQERFRREWRAFTVIELSDAVCEAAAEIAEGTGVRTVDALHLGAARYAGGGQLPIVTFDVRQAQAARAMGWTVLGI